MTTIGNKLNHRFTIFDAWEASSKAPIRKFVMPAVATALAADVLYNDYKHTTLPEDKQKVLRRDGLALLGMLGGITGGIAFSRSRYGATAAYNISKLFKRDFDPSHMQLSKGAKQALKDKPWAKNLHIEDDHGHGHHHEGHNHDHHDHGSEHYHTGIANRMAQIFKQVKHDHGIVGLLVLETMAAGSIGGGVLGGALGDKLNGENLKQTMPAKLYESIVQFLGNITICSIAIVTGGWLAKGAARQLLKTPAVDHFAQKRLLTHLQKIGTSTNTDLRRVPTEFTGTLEKAWIKLRNNPKDTHLQHHFVEDLTHWYSDYYPKNAKDAKAFKQLIERHLQQTPEDIKGLRTVTYDHLSGKLHRELEPFKGIKRFDELSNHETAHDFKHLAHERFLKNNERYGVIGGVAGGVVAGIVISNKLNDFLSRVFHMEKPDYKATLVHSNSHQSGILKDKVGTRPLHWWDVVLHADDWPSAMYMAGVEALEPIVRVLYGMSGYLAGVAGTTYSHASSHPGHHKHGNVPPGVSPFKLPKQSPAQQTV